MICKTLQALREQQWRESVVAAAGSKDSTHALDGKR